MKISGRRKCRCETICVQEVQEMGKLEDVYQIGNPALSYLFWVSAAPHQSKTPEVTLLSRQF